MNLNQITVLVADVAHSITFYKTLGLKLIVKSLPAYARFECPDGGSTFSLHKHDGYENSSGVWIYFEVTDVDEKVQQFIKEGIAFDELPEDKPWLWREARLQDLDNNTLIIYHAGDNRRYPPWRIQTAQ